MGLTGGLLAAIVVAALSGPIAASADTTIPAGGTGSLTVHKFENPSSPSTVANNGTEVSTAGLTPLPGVTFDVQQVNGIDLSTNAGWASASSLSGAFKPLDAEKSITDAGYTLRDAGSQTTGSDGSTKFAGLPIGLYLVTETGVPQEKDGKPVTVTPANPFLVTIPISTAQGTGTGWLYDVHVYPKNAVTTATKSADDTKVIQIGDPITWTITGGIAGVPVDLNGDGVYADPNEAYNIAGYVIEDPLNEHLVYQDGSTAISIVDDNGTQVVALAETTDYELSKPSSGNNNTLTVTFTKTGLDKLMANHGKTVKMTFDTVANATGSVTNTATVYPNGYTTSTTAGDPGTPVKPSVDIRFGGVEVLKTDQGTKPLDGAVFEVYTQLDKDGQPVAASKVTVDNGTKPVSQWTTGSNGIVTIDGLRWSDWADGKQLTDEKDPAWLDYYLVEVTASTGYSILAEPIHFLVEGDASTDVTKPDVTVKDTQLNAGFILPLTGSTGAGILIGAGVLLFGGGAALWLLMVARRKSRAAQESAAALL